MPRLFEKTIDPKTREGYESAHDIVEFYDKQVVVYPEKDNKDIFFVDSVSTELKRVNRRKYVNSFSGDVGVLNVVKKLALQGEQAGDGRFAAPSGYFDGTVLPKDGEEMLKLAKMKQAVWAKLDPELKGSMTYEDFASSIDNEKLKAFVKAKVQKKVAGKEAAAVKKEAAPVVEKKEGE